MSDATNVREWMKGLNTEDFNLVVKIRTSGDKEALTNLDTLKAALEESKIAAEKASEKEKYSPPPLFGQKATSESCVLQKTLLSSHHAPCGGSVCRP